MTRGSGLNRRIGRLAVPALGALAADPLVSLVDTAFVGRLGPVALGALGVDTALFSFAFLLFNFLAYGTTPFVAQAVGRGDPDRAGRVVVEALFLAVTIGVVAAGVLVVFGAAGALVLAGFAALGRVLPWIALALG
ncbi:MAG: MATE family efflux transporter, partial [Acidimicrobiia bacterium]